MIKAYIKNLEKVLTQEKAKQAKKELTPQQKEINADIKTLEKVLGKTTDLQDKERLEKIVG